MIDKDEAIRNVQGTSVETLSRIVSKVASEASTARGVLCCLLQPPQKNGERIWPEIVKFCTVGDVPKGKEEKYRHLALNKALRATESWDMPSSRGTKNERRFEYGGGISTLVAGPDGEIWLMAFSFSGLPDENADEFISVLVARHCAAITLERIKRIADISKSEFLLDFLVRTERHIGSEEFDSQVWVKDFAGTK